jgi:hypothetical protein
MNIAAAVAQHQRQGGTKTHRQIAAEQGLTYHQWRYRYRRFKAQNGGNPLTAPKMPQIAAQRQIALYQEYPETLDDTPKWEHWKRDRAQQFTRSIKILILNDLHIPDQDEEALKLATNLASVLQPEVILFGGDMFDFDALGRFQQHILRYRPDAYEEVDETWHRLTDNLVLACPDAVMVAFRGNHEKRTEDWGAATGGALYFTTEKAFVEIVSNGGKVWWLGMAHETFVGDLLIKHGDRIGENAAKNALKDVGWGIALVQGHGHYPNSYVLRVNGPDGYRVIQAVSSPCLCHIPPHYQMRRRHDSKWVHGVVTAHVHLDKREAALQPVLFRQREDGVMWCQYGVAEIDTQEVRDDRV